MIAPAIMTQVLVLIQSPLLQGLALESTIEFFLAVAADNKPGLQYQDIVAVI